VVRKLMLWKSQLGIETGTNVEVRMMNLLCLLFEVYLQVLKGDLIPVVVDGV